MVEAGGIGISKQHLRPDLFGPEQASLQNPEIVPANLEPTR